MGFLALAALLAAAALLLHGRWSGEAAVPPEAAAPPQGTILHVAAVDGDSLRAGRAEIRLLGIDAPELFQTCRDGAGREWPCGRAAHERLRALVADGALRCTPHGQDRFGRTLARCSSGRAADIGEAMVREGLAIDFMGGGYGAAEAAARAAKRGIWAGEFDPPQDWRRRNPRRVQSD